jgi:hypothetical protein
MTAGDIYRSNVTGVKVRVVAVFVRRWERWVVYESVSPRDIDGGWVPVASFLQNHFGPFEALVTTEAAR